MLWTARRASPVPERLHGHGPWRVRRKQADGHRGLRWRRASATTTEPTGGSGMSVISPPSQLVACAHRDRTERAQRHRRVIRRPDRRSLIGGITRTWTNERPQCSSRSTHSPPQGWTRSGHDRNPSVSGSDAENEAHALLAGRPTTTGYDVDHWQIDLDELSTIRQTGTIPVQRHDHADARHLRPVSHQTAHETPGRARPARLTARLGSHGPDLSAPNGST